MVTLPVGWECEAFRGDKKKTQRDMSERVRLVTFPKIPKSLIISYFYILAISSVLLNQ